jgi:hypothetical protein
MPDGRRVLILYRPAVSVIVDATPVMRLVAPSSRASVTCTPADAGPITPENVYTPDAWRIPIVTDLAGFVADAEGGRAGAGVVASAVAGVSAGAKATARASIGDVVVSVLRASDRATGTVEVSTAADAVPPARGKPIRGSARSPASLLFNAGSFV